MKTRFLMIIGIAVVGLTTFLLLPNEQQNTFEQMGGTWNADSCMITREIFDCYQSTSSVITSDMSG